LLIQEEFDVILKDWHY